MHILVVGLNHTTASVELRERVSIADDEIHHVLTQLHQTRTVMESVVLSTCNRCEIYAVVTSPRAGEDFLTTFLARRANVDKAVLREHLYIYSGEAAARHIMKVATGLDSLVIGETQILGQVRSAFQLAVEEGSTGSLLNQLFRMAIQVGKRAQTETTIGQNPVSVSYAAVQLAKKIFGNLQGHRALVLGAGKMSELTAQHLVANGISDLVISNRTRAKAEVLANKYQGHTVAWDEMESILDSVDIVISSTSAKGFVIHPHAVAQATSKRGAKPLVLLDIAMPRDIDPSVSSCKQVYLYDVDDLEGVVAANLAERERQGTLVGAMIDESLNSFSDWLAEQEVVPLIAAIRSKGAQIQVSVMESLENKLPTLSERDLKIIQKHTMSIVNQLLRDPIENMKELAIASGGAKHVQVFAELFGVSDEMLSSSSSNLALVGAGAIQPRTTETKSTEAVSPDSGFVNFVRQWQEAFLSDDKEGILRRDVLHPVLR